jgi:hypothetical protein
MLERCDSVQVSPNTERATSPISSPWMSVPCSALRIARWVLPGHVDTFQVSRKLGETVGSEFSSLKITAPQREVTARLAGRGLINSLLRRAPYPPSCRNFYTWP